MGIAFLLLILLNNPDACVAMLTADDGVILQSAHYTEADYLPEREWTPEIRAAVSVCWKEHEVDCVRECGGSLTHATDFCRVLRSDQSVVSFGWGCQMQAGYEQCVQTVELRQEIERLRKMLAECSLCTAAPLKREEGAEP